MARGFIPAGLRSSPPNSHLNLSDPPSCQALGLLLSPAGRCDVSLNPLATDKSFSSKGLREFRKFHSTFAALTSHRRGYAAFKPIQRKQGMHPRPNSHRLRRGRYSEPERAYLVTAVVHQRRPVFSDWRIGRLLVAEFKRAHDSGQVNSLAWVVMPDHFHWLLQIIDGHLSHVVGVTKARCTHSVNKKIGLSGPLWQSGFHDRAIRDDEDVRHFARYVVANPLRAGLVSRIGDYPLWDAAWL